MLRGTAATVRPRPGRVGRWRWVSALLVGMPCIVLVTGMLYSLLGARGGTYGENVLLALAHGCLMWLVFRLGRCERMPPAVVWLALALGCLGPVAVGHALAYRDLQSLAYQLVQEDVSGRYPAAWKSLSRRELFPEWVGIWTGTRGGGFWDCLRVRAAIGWEGWTGFQYRTYVVRMGIGSWIAWFWHLVLFAASGILAFLAAARCFPAAAASESATRARGITPGVPAVAEDAVVREGTGPEDLEASAAWTEDDERRRVRISYCYEPRGAFPSLHDFLAGLVKRRLSHVAQRHLARDVHNYLERVCVMKVITRSELVAFISRYGWTSVGGCPPKVPQELKLAVLCRDERCLGSLPV